MEQVKELLFSLTSKDFHITFLRGSGNGGQKKQIQNRSLAFSRCVGSKEFQGWLKLEIAARVKGYKDAESLVNEEMKNIKIEVIENGEWRVENEEK